jgi:hypothetical protein
LVKNANMDTTKPPESAIPPEVMADLEEAARYAASGIRDPEVMRRACERMDRTREEIFRRHGLLDFAVPTIRALRDGDDDGDEA